MTVGRSHRAGVVAVALLLLAVASGCSGGGSTSATQAPSAAATEAVPSDSDSAGPTAAASAEVPESPIAGIVVDVKSTGLNQVSGFTLLANNGSTIEFVLGILDNPADFPPGHLTEHQATAAPIFVFFHDENGKLVVYHLEDAG